MSVDIVKIPSSFSTMKTGPLEESWNRMADIIFADAAQSGVNVLTVYLPESWDDMQWLTLRLEVLPQHLPVLKGVLWISDDACPAWPGVDRIYWVHGRTAAGNPSPTLARMYSYSIWTRQSRWWGAGVRLADFTRATALRDRLMSRAQEDFVQPRNMVAQFHLHIYQREGVPGDRTIAASDR